MSVIAVTGKSFTVTVNATDYSAQITSGSIARQAQSTRIETLSGDVVVTTRNDDTLTADFLYDGATAFYMALYTATTAKTDVSVSIIGDDGAWAGDMYIDSLSAEFPADGAATCSASLSGTLTFAVD